jgi:hypothetical protein
MPIKKFCDRCGNETIENWASNSFMIELDGWQVEIVAIKKDEPSMARIVLCSPCVRRIVWDGSIQE